MIAAGAVVKFRNPFPDEDPGATYQVLEDRGPRVLVVTLAEFWKGKRLAPTFSFPVDDLVEVEGPGQSDRGR